MASAADPGTRSHSGPADMSLKRHVLLVEDNVELGQTLGQVLRRAGFGVSVASDFRLALQVLEAPHPLDLMLTDIVMPRSVNGLALSRMARMRRPDLKVIYITGFDIPEAEKEAFGPVLRKPVDGAALVTEIERALAG